MWQHLKWFFTESETAKLFWGPRDEPPAEDEFEPLGMWDDEMERPLLTALVALAVLLIAVIGSSYLPLGFAKALQ